jgi:hypothetical protein
MSETQKLQQRFTVKLTQAQRIVVAEVVAHVAERLRLDEPNERTVPFTLDEIREIHEAARQGVRRADSGMKRNSLRHVVYATEHAIERFQGIGRIPVKERIYQFKIALKGWRPPIWRRIQVRDCTLDKLHERIQTAMGWNTSHLHHFRINDKLYGDPWLMRENFFEFGYADSTVATLSKILPKSGERFRFEYEYDFGDSWWHDVLFEGCLRAEPGQRYPLCVEGERACPPDDVGGTPGYQEFLEVIAGPDDERLEATDDPDDEPLDATDELGDLEREQYLTWIGGSFDPEAFDPETATKRMRRGLPNWRARRGA